jgi:hypothetical protein
MTPTMRLATMLILTTITILFLCDIKVTTGSYVKTPYPTDELGRGAKGWGNGNGTFTTGCITSTLWLAAILDGPKSCPSTDVSLICYDLCRIFREVTTAKIGRCLYLELRGLQ